MLYGWQAPMKDLSGKKPLTALKMIYGYPAHTECIKALAMMMEHDGKTLLTGGNDEMIKIYNVKKKVEVGILMQHKGAITCLEYYGKSHVLSGSADNTICIWRTSDWNCIHILGGHKGAINSIAVHPSGKLAFSVARDKTLRMWNLVKGRSAYIRRLDQEATCVFLSQDGNRYGLVMGTDVSIFGSDNAELVGSLEHKKKVHTAAFATNDLVVLGTEDGVFYLYRAQGQLLAKITHADITARIRCMQVVAKADGELPLVVLASTNGMVHVYDLAQFSLDEGALDANNEVQPVATAKLFGTALVTCLSACRMDVETAVADEGKKKAKKESKPKTDLVAAKKNVIKPTVVVEHEVSAPTKMEAKKQAKRKAIKENDAKDEDEPENKPVTKKPKSNYPSGKKQKKGKPGKKLNDNKPVAANWDDEEEEDETPAPVANKAAAPSGPLKPKQLKKQMLKEQEEKHKLELAIAKARAEEERNMTADELKAKQQRALEHADFENTLDVFGLSAGPTLERKKVAGVNELETIVTGMKLACLADHEELGSLVGKRLANSNAKHVVEFMKTLISHASNNLTADDMKDITTIINVIKNDKIAAAKPKGKKKKITGKQGYAKVERSGGGGGGVDDFDDDDDFDDFM
ncbi:Aste57867_21676 [Aphanomyces stellatus]|uniref:Aste57867_21676 protein n=1 Tax=Aphanomyces stellatus TaxID=120398 RepID=A0A485LIT5_9STRA|nr:hypothetical protein As57867_021607 [Aphanomyces stellatus]VFT98345.1 Aste57867_21676 [Aphanomyces stellatus]